MSLPDVLAIALGLAFTYALFSMLASVIKEAVAAKLQWRAKGLSAAIDDMLAVSGQANAAWGRLSDSVYKHGLVSGISQNDRPSYLPARNFTLALLDTLSAGSQAPAITAVEGAVQSLPAGELKQRLTVLVNEAAGDVDALKDNVDKWFDDAMDRLSGTYKRYSQGVLFAIGIGLAIILNVNTLRIVNSLQHGAAAKAAELAQAFHDAHPNSSADASDLEKFISALPVPIGWTFCSAAGTLESAEDSKPAADPKDTRAATGAADANAAAARAVRGDPCAKDSKAWVQFGVVVAEGPWDFASELLGWLLTAIAISFGAPFWFDLMGQLINIRSTGPKPPRADAQAADASQ